MAKLLRHLGLGGKKTPPQQSRPDFISQGFQPKAQGTDRISGIIGEGDLGRRIESATTRSLPLPDPGTRCPGLPPPPPPPLKDSPTGDAGWVDGGSPTGSGGVSLLQESASSAPTLRAESGSQLPRDGAVSCDLNKEEEGEEFETMEACGMHDGGVMPYELKDLSVSEASAKPKYYDPYASTATMPLDSAQSTMDASDFGHYRNLPVITAVMQGRFQDSPGSQIQLQGGAEEAQIPNGDSSADVDEDDDDDLENYMDLQEEEIVVPRIGNDRQVNETWRTASPSLRSACIDAGINNYDEPWDLANTRRELEERLRAVQKVEPSAQKGSERSSQAFEGSDDRPQEGYDKPWDLQPHMKDDRGQEGYDKPWDLKPHQKDLRPAQEYDVPWDKKVKNIERDLIAAKRAKDAAKSDGAPAASVAAVSTPPGAAGLQLRTDNAKAIDTRPGCDYDEPWDQKKKNLVSKVSDQAMKGTHSPAPGSQFPPGPSRSSGVWAKTLGERIDPKIPLKMQTWYHGSISRMDAENLLRVHREGSYLVRTSESNQDDYSLSVKSIRGFMHMKIVKSADGRYILGQFSQPFQSIPQMIYHYTVNKLPIKGADHMSLMYPISNELL